LKTFTVHEPAEPDSDPLKRVDQLVFIKEGVAWLALFFPVIWLLVQRMWLVLALFILAAVGISAAANSLGVNQQLAGWIVIALGVVLAFQANDLRRWKFDRKGYRMVAAVAGSSREDCERRFFADWADEMGPGEAFLPELEDVPGGWENDLDTGAGVSSDTGSNDAKSASGDKGSKASGRSK
jgi:hypothetical protein